MLLSMRDKVSFEFVDIGLKIADVVVVVAVVTFIVDVVDEAVVVEAVAELVVDDVVRFAANNRLIAGVVAVNERGAAVDAERDQVFFFQFEI